ncbi:MAG: bifunctional oligoribonuclease/PAP phosphatase NrnA [Deltaproteobacteria bacterium]|nr:MAG: bifunctional oligoribonuclease/PAP phosphatase NrnA [Deltaproteobacteria bacterium]
MRNQKKFKILTEKSKNILITTHAFPDADGIGSQIALCLALRKKGHNAICVNEAPLRRRYKYLDNKKVVKSADGFKKNPLFKKIDLTLVVDTHSLSRVGSKTEKIIEGSLEILFIDHHPTSKEIMAIHIIDTSKAATGEIVGQLISSVLKVEFTEEIALPLYTAILIDTSSFRYPNVTGNTHRILAKLLDAGVNPPTAYNQIYGTKKLANMALLGEILSNIKATDDQVVAWITITEKMLAKYKVNPEDTHSFINYLLVLKNLKVACMFRENEKFVKVSLRSTGEIDVSSMAQALGGGGHFHSAATSIQGPLRAITLSTINKIKLMLKE